MTSSHEMHRLQLVIERGGARREGDEDERASEWMNHRIRMYVV